MDSQGIKQTDIKVLVRVCECTHHEKLLTLRTLQTSLSYSMTQAGDMALDNQIPVAYSTKIALLRCEEILSKQGWMHHCGAGDLHSWLVDLTLMPQRYLRGLIASCKLGTWQVV